MDELRNKIAEILEPYLMEPGQELILADKIMVVIEDGKA